MTLLKINYSPGFSEDLTSWDATIYDDGKVYQAVNVSTFSPREEYKKEYKAHLSEAQLNELKQFAKKIDFEALEKELKQFVIDDVEQITITVNDGSRNITFCAPIEYWEFEMDGGKMLNEAIFPVLGLWSHLGLCLPYTRKKA